MHLTDEARVRARLNLGDDSGVVDVIQSCLDGATVHLESLLDTGTDAGEFTDTFYLDSAVHVTQAGMYQLRLANGFLDSSVPVEIVYGDSLAEMDLQLAASDVKVNWEKGFVLVSDEYADQFVSITYTAGFSTVNDVPDWLREWALAHTIKMMSMQQTQDEKPALAKVYQMIEQHKVTILDRKLRESSRCIRPLHSA